MFLLLLFINDYKRGNKWTEISSSTITLGPEVNGVANELNDQFTKIIQQYEIKIEQAPESGQTATYKASPQTTNQNITVGEVGTSSGYKGFKHDVGDGNTINLVTIHNQPIVAIPPINDSLLQGKQYVYVYYSISDATYEKPLLICLQDSTGNTKTWYQREKRGGENGYEWKTTNNFSDENPDVITTGFADKLGTIKNTLDSGGTDTGYTKLVSI